MRTLETERLTLTAYRPEDAQDLYDYAKNPNVGPIAGWAPHKNVEESEMIIREMFMPVEAWAIRLKGQDKVIGTIALEYDKYRPESNSREIGYSLAEEHWKHGYMTEAAKEVMKFAFDELGLDQIGICTGEVNKRSQRVIEKCGFKYEGTIRRTYKVFDGTCRDSLVFSILRDEYYEMMK